MNDITICDFKDEAIEAYKDWADDLNVCLNDKNNINDFLTSLHYDVMDNAKDVIEAQNILTTLENILIKHFLGNSGKLIK